MIVSHAIDKQFTIIGIILLFYTWYEVLGQVTVESTEATTEDSRAACSYGGSQYYYCTGFDATVIFEYSGRARIAEFTENVWFDLPALYVQKLPGLTHLTMVNCSITTIDVTSLSGPTGLRYLNLSYNQIGFLPESIFQGLPLEIIDISHNKLDTIQETLYKGLTQLHTLVLSNNEIQEIGTVAFQTNKKLTRLTLSYNKIYQINSGDFNTTAELQLLELDNNQIESVERHTFRNIFTHPESLVINLSNNFMKDIGEDVFHQDLKIKALDVRRNPFSCDVSTILLLPYNFKYLYIGRHLRECPKHVHIFPRNTRRTPIILSSFQLGGITRRPGSITYDNDDTTNNDDQWRFNLPDIKIEHILLVTAGCGAMLCLVIITMLLRRKKLDKALKRVADAKVYEDSVAGKKCEENSRSSKLKSSYKQKHRQKTNASSEEISRTSKVKTSYKRKQKRQTNASKELRNRSDLLVAYQTRS